MEQHYATSAQGGAKLARQLRVDFFRAVVGANLLGAAVVASFLTLVVPDPPEIDAGRALLVDAVGLGYILVAIPVGVRWGRSLAGPIVGWLAESRPRRRASAHARSSFQSSGTG